MRASFVIPSVLAATVLVAAGTIWADAATHRTVVGHPAAIGATGGAVTSVTATQPPTPAPHATPRTSVKPSPTAGSARSTGGLQIQHAVVPYRPATRSKTSTVRRACAATYTSGASSIETAVFTLLNQQREANGLCPMQWSSLLQRSARGHSVLMDQKSTANDCSDGGYSHRYSGEPDISTRIYATGYPHTPIAEAIGCSPDTSTGGALTLQRLMYNETPPANQHREMILSTRVDHVGIAIVIDPSNSTLWLTEDFGG
jgi:uncharacterized protein YkwD